MAEKNDLTKHIGERLRLARQLAGYRTISDFVHKHKFAKSTYTQYETGARSFHTELAVQFASLFKTNLIWLLTGKGSSGYTDDDLAVNTPEQISQDELLSILTKGKKHPTANLNKTTQKKISEHNVVLLSDILGRIMQGYQKQKIPFDYKHIADITFGIYFDVISKTHKKEEQCHIIEAAVSTFVRMMQFKRKAG